MPLPHEQVAIDAASGRRRNRLIAAAAVLDRMRAEHPGVDDFRDLPPGMRNAVRPALRAFRPAAGFGLHELGIAAFLAVGLIAAWVKPVRVFRCAPQAAGLAQCLVSERVFGVFPVREQAVAGIAKAQTSSYDVTSESQEDGRTTTSTTRLEELVLLDASENRLWSAAEQRMLGASAEQLGTDLTAVVSGQRTGPLLRIQVCWPVLLITCFFVLISFGPLVSQIGLALHDRGLIPYGMHRWIFGRGAFLLSVALCSVPWGMALLGSDPPALLVRLVGLR
jgi:hypothetical protein